MCSTNYLLSYLVRGQSLITPYTEFTFSLDAVNGDGGTSRDFELDGVLGNSAAYNQLRQWQGY